MSFSSTVPVLPPDGLTQAVVTATVTDKNGNSVGQTGNGLEEEGRPALWLDDASGGIIKADEAVTNGVCKATIEAGELKDTQTIGLSVDAAFQTTTIDVSPVRVTLTSNRTHLDVYKGQKAHLTAIVLLDDGTPVPDGTPISWFTSNGAIEGPTALSGGVSTAQLNSVFGRIGKAVITVGLPGYSIAGHVSFISTAPVSMAADQTFVTTDGSSPAEVTFHGPPNGSVQLGLAGIQVAYYPFSQIKPNGKVAEVIYGNDGAVHGATLDTVHYSSPPASLSFNGSAYVKSPNAKQLHITNDLIVSAAILPTAFADSTIVRKYGEYELALRSDGRVSFTVLTPNGTYTATTPNPIILNQWSGAVGIFSNNQVQVYAGATSAQVSSVGNITPTSHSLMIGATFDEISYSRYFTGNIDDVSIGVLGLFVITGGSPGGRIPLDGNGNATIGINSAGPEQGDDNPIGTFVIAATVYDQDNVKVDDVDEEFHRIDTKFWNQLKEGLTQDLENIKKGVEEVVSSLLALGSIKLIARVLGGRGVHGWKDWLKVSLALLDIAVTYGVFIGKSLAIVTKGVLLKATAAKGVKFAMVLGLKVKNAAKGNSALIEELEELLKWLNKTGKIDIAQKVLTSDREWKSLNEIFKKGGQFGEEIAERILAKAAAHSPEVGKKMIQTMRPLSEAIIKEIGVSEHAMEGLAKSLNNGLNGTRIRIALNNALLSSDYYTRTRLLTDLGEIAHVPGAEKVLSGIFKARKNLGHRYELEFAAELNRTKGVKEIDRDMKWGLRWSDIDVVDKSGLHYQLKLAIKRKLKKEMSYAKAAAKAAGDTPPSLKSVVYVSRSQSRLPKSFLDWLTEAPRNGKFEVFDPH